MIFVSLYIVIVPIIGRPEWSYLYALVIIALGLLSYYPSRYLRMRGSCTSKLERFMQLLLRVAVPDKTI